MNVANASLVLDYNDLTLGETTQYGQIDILRQNMTWYNINFRNLLGKMYDDFDTFNLSINSIIGVGGTLTATTNRTIIIKMEGLPFVNNTYSVKQGGNTNQAVVCALLVGTGTTSTDRQFVDLNPLTFRKCEMADISLRYYQINAVTQMDGTLNFPAMSFLFNITGVEPSKPKLL